MTNSICESCVMILGFIVLFPLKPCPCVSLLAIQFFPFCVFPFVASPVLFPPHPPHLFLIPTSVFLLCSQRYTVRLGGAFQSPDMLTYVHLQQVGNQPLLVFMLPLYKVPAKLPNHMTTCVLVFLCFTCTPTSVSSSSSPALCTSAANSLTLCSQEFQLITLTTSATVSNLSSSLRLPDGDSACDSSRLHLQVPCEVDKLPCTALPASLSAFGSTIY